MSYKLISNFIFLFIIYKINSERIIKFHLFNIQSTSLSFNLISFVNYYVENIFTTDILIGEPSQNIPAYLNPSKSGFFLTNNSCPLKHHFLFEKSNNYKLISKKSYNFFNIYYISDSLSFENEENKIDNYTFFVDCELIEPLCLNFGTKIISKDEEIKDSLLNNLH